MSMLEHARREVELAKEIKKQDLEEGEFDYGGICYDSALKAFESLTQDGHSGFSINITKHILNRLIEGKPLSAIMDVPDIWGEGTKYTYEDPSIEGFTTYQCKRLSSLFKYIYNSGRIVYRDIDSIQCIDVNTDEMEYYGWALQETLDKISPIRMPYMPSSKPTKVYCSSFLADPKDGDYDTICVLYSITPDDVKTIINKCFKEENNKWVEISISECNERYKRYKRGDKR